MALTAEEQKLYDFAKNALPAWIPDADEFLMGAAKLFGSVRALVDYLFGMTLIGEAVGATAETPDWLNQHAIDRGTRRQAGEDDDTLKARLRQVPEAITRASILAAVNAILLAEGVAGSAAMVELPRDGAHSGTYVADTGTGGVFAKTGDTVTFTPTVPFAGPPYRDPSIAPLRKFAIVISGADDAGNDGTFPITGLVDHGATFENPAGVADAVDAGVTWLVQQLDPEDNIRTGFTRAYSRRGYRGARLRPASIVIILPYGSTSGTEASVREMLRMKKAAGIVAIIERRITIP